MGMHIKRNGVVKLDSIPRVRIDCPLDAGDFVPGSDSITTAMLEDGSVTTDKIADGDVTVAKMAANSVDSDQYVDGSIDTVHLSAGAVTLPKLTTTGIKVLSAAGVDSSGGDAEATFTGTAIGDRLVAIFGAPTAGGALAAKVPGTHFESVITVTNKIVQKQAAGNLSASTFVAILIPAAA